MQQLAQRDEEVAALKKLWESNGLPPIREAQFNIWIGLHDFELMIYTFRRLVKKQGQLGGVMSADHAIRFASSIANTKAREAQEKQ